MPAKIALMLAMAVPSLIGAAATTPVRAQAQAVSDFARMQKTVVSVSAEQETTTSRFARRIYHAFGVERAPTYARSKAGSGVVVDAYEGLIVTSAFLVPEDGVLMVGRQASDDSELPQEFVAQLVAHDDDAHIAVLQVEPRELAGLNVAAWGRSQGLDIGDGVVSICSVGVYRPYTQGLLTGDDVELEAGDSIRGRTVHEEHLLASDTSLMGCGPGGPLYSLGGALEGIITFQDLKYAYAVPIERVGALIERARADVAINFPGMP